MIRFEWDGAEHLLRAGELHNSTASGKTYLRDRWKRLEELHLNCVLAPISWELIEPSEGAFCFDTVATLLSLSRESGIRLILLWFGLWKNGASAYVPTYVKLDQERFVLCRHEDGSPSRTVSPFCNAAVQADRRAFGKLAEYIRDNDAEQRVLAVQVENEVGFLGGLRDWSKEAEPIWARGLPDEVARLRGLASPCSWEEAFGRKADESFMAYGFAKAVNEIARAGKAALDRPMLVNAWTDQYDDELPSLRPSGGPGASLLSLWRALAPAIDAFAPDCYLEELDAECRPYLRPDQPLLIPELRMDRHTPAFILYAMGELGAVCASPFGIDGGEQTALENVQAGAAVRSAEDCTQGIADVYRSLAQLEPMILQARARGRVRGVLHGSRPVTGFDLGGYHLRARFTDDEAPMVGGGLIFSPCDGEYYALGLGFRLECYAKRGRADFLEIEEGECLDGRWVPTRRLNGDEQNVTLGKRVSVRHFRLFTIR